MPLFVSEVTFNLLIFLVVINFCILVDDQEVKEVRKRSKGKQGFLRKPRSLIVF